MAKIKSKKIKIEVTKYFNGNILLDYDECYGDYTLKTSDGIMTYSRNEMKEMGYL